MFTFPYVEVLSQNSMVAYSINTRMFTVLENFKQLASMKLHTVINCSLNRITLTVATTVDDAHASQWKVAERLHREQLQ